MKKQQTRVQDIFKRFDSDNSQSLDATEFHLALLELGIPETLKIPDAELGSVLQEVFDTMDDDGNGVLSFKEINHYLRAGRHEVVLDDKLKAGAVQVHDAVQQAHRLRRKEEWKALERFEALDVDNSGDASIRELHAFFVSEGYSEPFVKGLLTALDVDMDGTLTTEEWRKGVAMLKGSSLLMSMTDPMDPPTGENFKDLQTPYEAKPHPGYGKERAGTTVTPNHEYENGRIHRGCDIPEPELRGTKVAQLRTVCEHVVRRCDKEKWVDTDGVALEAKKVTMYDTAAYVLKPATKKRRNSYIETVCKGPQPAKWFCSHWWGMSVIEMLACLEQHARDRHLDLNNATYWISSFAFSLWNLKHDHLPENPLAAPMMRAMETCDGTISVVDTQATYWGRCWCVYEVGKALDLAQQRDLEQRGAFLYDMYTPSAHKLSGELVERISSDGEGTGRFNFCGGPALEPNTTPPPLLVDERRYAVGICDGLTASDRSPASKSAREGHFPTEMLAPALALKIQAGTASVDTDRWYILNAVRGADEAEMREEAPFSSPRYTEVNAGIRGFCAKASLARAVIEHCNGNGTMFSQLLAGLQESTVTRIDLCFEQALREQVEVPYKVFESLLDALPPTVEHLVIELPQNVSRLPNNKLKTLPQLHTFELRSVALEELPEDLVECFKLQTLDLVSLHALKELPKRVFEMSSINLLNLADCTQLKSLHARGVAKSTLETLVLRDCTGLLTLPDTLGNNLVNLHTLNMRGCANLQSVPSWVAEMERAGVAVQRPHHLE